MRAQGAVIVKHKVSKACVLLLYGRIWNCLGNFENIRSLKLAF